MKVLANGKRTKYRIGWLCGYLPTSIWLCQVKQSKIAGWVLNHLPLAENSISVFLSIGSPAVFSAITSPEGDLLLKWMMSPWGRMKNICLLGRKWCIMELIYSQLYPEALGERCYSHAIRKINFSPLLSMFWVYLLKALIMSAKYTKTWNWTTVARASQESWG